MKITGNIWAKKIKEEHPGSIKGQFTGSITYLEKRGKLKVTLTTDEFLMILLDADNDFTQQFRESVENCDYPELTPSFDAGDFEVEVTNA